MSKSRQPNLLGLVVSIAVAAIAASVAPVKAATDPKVTALLTPILHAHEQVRSFECTIKLFQQSGTRSETDTLGFAFRSPDQAKATITTAKGPVLRCTCNGKKILIYSPMENKYLDQPVKVGRAGALAVAAATQSLLLKAYVDPRAMIDMLSDPDANAHMAGISQVNGVPVEIVDVDVDTTGGHNVTAAFSFGQRDHLLRSVVLTRASTAGPSRVGRIDETVEHMSIDPRLTAADFVVSIPRGASEITQADMSGGLYDPRLKPGAVPFPIDAVDISGKPVSLAEYKGKVLLIDFWATWCGPCMMEMPNVLAVYKQYHAQGLEVVGFSQDQDEGSLKSVIAQRGIPWRQVFCGGPGGEKVPASYGIQAIPFMVLVGRDGKIAAVDLRGEALGAAVKAALAR